MGRKRNEEQELANAATHALKMTNSTERSRMLALNKLLNHNPTVQQDTLDYARLQVARLTQRQTTGQMEAVSVKQAQKQLVWSPQYSRTAGTPSKLLSPTCTALHQDIFSPWILKGLRVLPQKEPCQVLLACFIEYLTDYPKEFPIPKDDRDLDKMITILRARLKPERLQEFFPTSNYFANKGHYIEEDLRASGGGIMVKMKFWPGLGQRQVPKVFTGAVKICDNHSKADAYIMQVETDQLYKLSLMFPDALDEPLEPVVQPMGGVDPGNEDPDSDGEKSPVQLTDEEEALPIEWYPDVESDEDNATPEKTHARPSRQTSLDDDLGSSKPSASSIIQQMEIRYDLPQTQRPRLSRAHQPQADPGHVSNEAGSAPAVAAEPAAKRLKRFSKGNFRALGSARIGVPQEFDEETFEPPAVLL